MKRELRNAKVALTLLAHPGSPSRDEGQLYFPQYRGVSIWWLLRHAACVKQAHPHMLGCKNILPVNCFCSSTKPLSTGWIVFFVSTGWFVFFVSTGWFVSSCLAAGSFSSCLPVGSFSSCLPVASFSSCLPVVAAGWFVFFVSTGWFAFFLSTGWFFFFAPHTKMQAQLFLDSQAISWPYTEPDVHGCAAARPMIWVWVKIKPPQTHRF